MSVADVVARVAQLEHLARRVASSPSAPAPQTSFDAVLTSELRSRPISAAPTSLAPTGLAPTGLAPTSLAPAGLVSTGVAPAGSDAGARALAAAQAEVGVSEEPPGSNDGARIAAYRTAVAGAAPGVPWCAYFVSWAAAQAGAPLGENGSGFGLVASIGDWAARTGRLLPADGQPAPGDLILFGDRHVGLVESVNADGTITTVEGNSSDAVRRVVRSRAETTGFVRIG